MAKHFHEKLRLLSVENDNCKTTTTPSPPQLTATMKFSSHAQNEKRKFYA